MKHFLFVLGLTGLAAFGTYGQISTRIFDNFDRSQGVPVYVPAKPGANPKSLPKNSPRTNRTGEEKLVKKTGQMSPSDGLALNETYATRGKLAMGTGTDLRGFTTGNAAHDGFIVESSRRYGIDPLLIYAQMHQESTFKIMAISRKGARGLMQLMPPTARRFGVTNIYDPKQNIEGGVRYMRWLLDTFNGDVILALAGYNAGEGAVMRYGWQIPPYRETQEYVRRITSRYNSISDPNYVQTGRGLGDLAARQRQSRPLTVYEPAPLAVRLGDGRMMLLNQ